MAAERRRKDDARGRGRNTRRSRASEESARPRGRRSETRKERVLHTRISEKLADDIYRVAEDLRVPASNLVRNVLEDAFSVVESVTDNVGDLIESILDEAERARERISRGVERTRRAVRASAGPADVDEPRSAGREGEEPPEFPEILGWQPLLLNHARRCSDCGMQLGRGERAVVGITNTGLTETYLCLACMSARK